LDDPSTTTTPAPESGPAQADLTVVGGAGHVGMPRVFAFTEAAMTANVNDLTENP
jgi:UDP-N-acetyl-D-mannosaminuronic acid dehydrogenase